MLLEILDKLECPVCGENIDPNKLEGDMTEIRIVDGLVNCYNSHSWQVREEVLRFDQENSDEEMQLLDYDKTGFPSTEMVGEMERGEFLTKFNEYVDSFPMDNDQILKVSGSSILFFKYLKENNRKIIVTHPNEGILRQIQVLAVRKQIYNNMAFIRAYDATLNSSVNNLYLFFKKEDVPELNEDDIAIIFDQSLDGEIIWTGEKFSLFESSKL